MRTSRNGVDLIKSFEGLRLQAYKDPVGIWTIGYGTIKNVVPGLKIDLAKAEALLQADIAVFEPEITRLVKVPLNQNQWDALMSFTYNLGSKNLGSSTLLKLLNAKDYTGAANQLPRWNKAGGVELAGLTRRRAAERALFLKPV